MIEYTSTPRSLTFKKVALLVAGGLAYVGLIAAAAFLLNAGSKTAAAMAVALIVLPILTYIALARPVIFPLAIYAALIPFDAILSFAQFGTITKLLAILSGAALLLWIVRFKSYMQPGKALYVWGALVVWMGCTLFWALDITSAVPLYITFIQLFLLYCVVSVFPVREADFRILVGTIIFGSSVAAAYGAYLFHAGVGLQNERLFIQSDQGQISPNHFAASLMLPLAIVAMATFRARLSFSKLALGALALLLTSGVYYGASRAGFFALALMLLYFFWKTRYKVQIALCGIVVVLISFVESTAIWTRFSESSINGGSGRVDIWHVGIEAVKQHWLFGVGVGGFPAAFDQSFLSVFQPFYTHWHRAAHNLFFESITELGILGLALMLGAWYAQFRLMADVSPANRFYDLRIALEGATIGLFASAMFGDIMFIKYTWLTFSLAALARSLAKPSIARNSGPVFGRGANTLEPRLVFVGDHPTDQPRNLTHVK